MIAFIENKAPDMARIGSLLEHCRTANHWANRGPLYRRLAEAYSAAQATRGAATIEK